MEGQIVETKGGLKKIFGPITVDNVGASLNEKKHQAQLRQQVLTVYPGVRTNDSLSQALFPEAAFGAKSQEFVEERVTWIPIPIGTTKEAVEAQLKNCKNPRLVKFLSLKPILTEEQANAIKTGLSQKTLKEYEAEFVIDENEQPALYNGKHQYRSVKFYAEAIDDVDNRPADFADMTPVSMTSAEAVKSNA